LLKKARKHNGYLCNIGPSSSFSNGDAMILGGKVGRREGKEEEVGLPLGG